MSSRRNCGQVYVRFEVFDDDLSKVDPCEPTPDGWIKQTETGLLQDAQRCVSYDVFRRVYYHDAAVERLEVSTHQPTEVLQDWGHLGHLGHLPGIRPSGPAEYTFTFPGIRFMPVPGSDTPCWFHVWDYDVLQSYEFMPVTVEFPVGGLTLTGFDRSIPPTPPTPPKPCPKCEKRRQKKVDKQAEKYRRSLYDY